MASILGSFLADKPRVPQYRQVDFEKEQKAAISGNLGALPILQQLASQTNDYNASQVEAQLERAIPGYRGLVNQGTENIQSALRGEIPDDVSRLLKQRAAESGVALGTSGSQFNKYDELRNLGLTSLEQTQRGLDSATRWISAAQSRAPMMDVSSMFITPQQRVGVKMGENANIFQRNWLKNQVAAVPDGWEGALIALEGNIGSIVGASSGYAWGSAGGSGPQETGGGGGL